MVVAHQSLTNLNAQELREMVAELIAQVGENAKTIVSKDREILYRQTKIDQLTHEMAVLKRLASSDEAVNSSMRGRPACWTRPSMLTSPPLKKNSNSSHTSTKTNAETPKQPKRAALPPELPRVEHLHEPDSTVCTTPGCGCALRRIGEDISEKLDYTPGLFTVERHVRGKWACAKCQTLTQAPVPAQIIDKGMATSGLLAQVLVAKYADHLPLYRQETIFARAGMALPRSTLAQWVGVCGVQLQPLVDALKGEILSHAVLHADETPVAMLKPGNKKTHRAYLWAYAPGAFEALKAVVYDFCESRAGEHARTFLGDWKGALVCDDFAGYKQSFTLGILEAGCLAHSRRKLY